jgi:hypothetical protein
MAGFGLGLVRKELRSWAHKTPEFKKRGIIKERRAIAGEERGFGSVS